MKKLKFFGSLYKERDWLEEMAAKGWLLCDMTMGCIYHFREIEPAQKVFEIENFGLSEYPSRQELMARKTALDIARQAGWEEAARDEDMNYYFVKDRAGDESDEFFDDEETRRERADKYRRRYGYEQPLLLLIILLMASILYTLLSFDDAERAIRLMRFFMACNLIIVAIVTLLLGTSQQMYQELGMTREQWAKRKKFGEKRSFGNVEKLLAWLQEKQQQGLVLASFERGCFLFEEGTENFDYCVDTKRALSRRLKQRGEKLETDKKDWNDQGTGWYEMSMEQAQAAGLEFVCVVEKGVILYRRPHTDAPEPFDTRKEYMGVAGSLVAMSGFLLALLVIGFVAGFLAEAFFS